MTMRRLEAINACRDSMEPITSVNVEVEFGQSGSGGTCSRFLAGLPVKFVHLLVVVRSSRG